MTLRIAVVGAGYWGPNLVRNFQASPDWDLVAVCDLDVDAGPAGARVARSDGAGRAVARRRAGPRRRRCRRHRHAGRARTSAIALAALRGRQARAGREAAGADRRGRPASWSTAAERARPGAHVRPHLLLHPGGAARSASSSRGGELGDIQFVDSVRINLGLVQPRRRRAVGPRPARPVDPRLRPARRAAARRAWPRTAPTRSAPARPASAT